MGHWHAVAQHYTSGRVGRPAQPRNDSDGTRWFRKRAGLSDSLAVSRGPGPLSESEGWESTARSRPLNLWEDQVGELSQGHTGRSVRTRSSREWQDSERMCGEQQTQYLCRASRVRVRVRLESESALGAGSVGCSDEDARADRQPIAPAPERSQALVHQGGSSGVKLL